MVAICGIIKGVADYFNFSMFLKKRWFVLLIATAIIIASGLYFLLNLVVSNSFNKLEVAVVTRNNQRVENILSNFLSSLESQVGDWAHWDEPWKAVEGPEVADPFLKENLTSDALATLRVNFICFYDTAGKVIASKGVSLPGGEDDPTAPIACGVMGKYNELFNMETLAGLGSGYVDAGTGVPLLAVSSAITRSDGSGPSHGYILFARFIDAGLMSEVKNLSMFPVEAAVVGSRDLPDDFKKAQLAFSQGANLYTSVKDRDAIYGYVLFRDLNKKAFFIVRSEMPREIYSQSVPVARFFGAVSFLIGFLIIVIVTLMGRLIDAAKAKEEITSFQVRTKELEEMNKIMIGREIKMVELKERAAKLQRELTLIKNKKNPDNHESAR